MANEAKIQWCGEIATLDESLRWHCNNRSVEDMLNGMIEAAQRSEYTPFPQADIARRIAAELKATVMALPARPTLDPNVIY